MHSFRSHNFANTNNSWVEQLLIQSFSSNRSSDLTLNKWQINVRHLRSLDWRNILGANISPLLIPVILQVKPSALSGLNDRKLETQLVSIKFPDSAFHMTGQAFPHLSLSLAHCPANNKRWKQLQGKVKVWKLTSCDLPPSDFSTSRERRRWYPAGWLPGSPGGCRPWPPSRTERRGRAVPSGHACWSGRRPSAWHTFPWSHSWSLFWGAKRGFLMAGGYWRVEEAPLTQGQPKLCPGSSPQLITALCRHSHPTS